MTSKARLPLVATRPSARATAPAGERAEQAIARVACNRALVCVLDDGAPEAALRFACGVLERVRASGHAGSVLSTPETLHAGAAQRLHALGATLHAVRERDLPAAAQRVFAESPADGVVVALGAAFAAHFEALLTVRLGARAGSARTAEYDLEITRDDELIATLIGDWIGAHIQLVSAEDSATVTKNPGA